MLMGVIKYLLISYILFCFTLEEMNKVKQKNVKMLDALGISSVILYQHQ